MTNNPSLNPSLVSVIIPVYNGARYLAEALDSVFAQDYRPLEVIVVDDGSTDNTASVAKSCREVRYLYQANQGPAAAKNAGLRCCTGNLVAFLDADDLWVPEKLMLQTKYLETHPEVSCVMGRMKNFLQAGIDKPSWADDRMFADNLVAYSLGAMLTYKRVFETVGDFNTKYLCGDNLDWSIRSKEQKIPVHTMQDVLLLRRIHSGNISSSREMKVKARILSLKEAIDRKRKAQIL